MATVDPLAAGGHGVGLLAGATAWCFDEPSASVVDAAPRGLAWRSAARTLGVLPLVLVWALAIWHGREALFGHPWMVALQGTVAMTAGAAWTLWRRSGGDATPGLLLATAVVPATTTWALVRPLGRRVPVFPYAFEGWSASTRLWLAAGVAGLALLGGALAEARWWSIRSRFATRRPHRP